MSLVKALRDLTAQLHDGGVLEVTNSTWDALMAEMRTPPEHTDDKEMAVTASGGWLVVRRKPC